jgi:hypothetical protein
MGFCANYFDASSACISNSDRYCRLSKVWPSVTGATGGYQGQDTECAAALWWDWDGDSKAKHATREAQGPEMN